MNDIPKDFMDNLKGATRFVDGLIKQTEDNIDLAFRNKKLGHLALIEAKEKLQEATARFSTLGIKK